MIHPHTELRSSSADVGHGVFATAPIPRGTLVYVKDPLEIHISLEQYETYVDGLKHHVDRYSYVEPTGMRVLSWDAAKFVNHSCEPNTMSTAWGGEVAVRDISEGEEITDEYGMFNLEIPMACACGTASCRGSVTSQDLAKYHAVWDETVRSALEMTPHVAQPLFQFLPTPDLCELQRYLAGASAYRSVNSLQVHAAAPSWASMPRMASRAQR